MLDVITPAAAAVAAATGTTMDAPVSVWGVVLTNLFAAIPPTIAAIAALVVSWRNSTRVETLNQKADQAAVKVEEAVNKAAEKTAVLEKAARAVKDAEQEVHRVVDITEARLSTASEDAKRAAEAVETILAGLREVRKDILAAIEANRAAKIVPAKDVPGDLA